MMERIIKFRLEAFVERFHILDAEQEGFRYFRSTINALLSLTQDIFNGFNMSKSTAAIFIDFEKAYDSVWREELMVKLSRSGVRGNLWNWINAFLNHREARCIVNDHTGVWFQTSIGLPQGSVIFPFSLTFSSKIYSITLLQTAVSLQMMLLYGTQRKTDS